MTSTKRENPWSEIQEASTKRWKNAYDECYYYPEPNLRVVLNPADCNLDFNIEGDGRIGHALYEEGFAYCWSGARANIGITGGKYYFGYKIVSDQPVNMEDTPLDQQNVCRIGISRGDDPVGNLGETEHSFGFGGTGKFSNAGRFSDYGERFRVGDTIVCLVDLGSKPLGKLEFSKNGKRLGVAKHLDAGPNGLRLFDSSAQKLPWESALFPHVLLKNTVVEMQFSFDDGLVPVEGYRPWAAALKDGKAVTGPSSSEPADCEVIMMVGLPAAGKSTWADKWMKEHPEKRCVLLGTNLALDQMKVPGLLRKNNYGERFDRLMDRATGIFNTLLSRASKVPGNYILDQTNVYKSARKRKLKPFASYTKIAVVVLTKPEELKLRAEKRFRETGKEVPPEAVNEMLANFVLPMSKDMRGTDEYFDKIIFPEINRVEAQQYLDEMKRTLAPSSGGMSKSDYLPYSRGDSVHSGSKMSASSLPGPGYNKSGYCSPALRNQGVPPDGSWVGSPVPAMQPHIVNASRGYAGPGQLSKEEPEQPYLNVNTAYRGPEQPAREEPFGGSYEESLNRMPYRDDAYQGAYASYTSSYPREEPMRYGSYTHDAQSRYDATYTSQSRYDAPYTSQSRYDATYTSQSRYDAPYTSQSRYDATYTSQSRYDAPYTYGTMGYTTNDGTPAYQPLYGSPYGIPNPKPYGGFQSNINHSEQGAAPYGGHPPRYY